jgi:hypothetical protein
MRILSAILLKSGKSHVETGFFPGDLLVMDGMLCAEAKNRKLPLT